MVVHSRLELKLHLVSPYVAHMQESSAGGRAFTEYTEPWKAAGENRARCIGAWGSVEQFEALLERDNRHYASYTRAWIE